MLIEHTIILALSFAMILAGSELFTNGVEWAGHRFEVAEAAVGSLFAAVGTALPETFVPAVALLTGREAPQAHQEVGVGAILGSPLMLATIALFVMGIACVVYRRRRGRIPLRVNRINSRRDLIFFMPIFGAVVLLGTFDLSDSMRRIAAIALLGIYACYSIIMLRLERDADAEVEHGLLLESMVRGEAKNPRTAMIVAQVAAGVGLILVGAIDFVDQVIEFSKHVGLNPGVLSLLLSPLATELPEKYNSVVWIRQGKDHLALANITGAMVFQACIPVALGVGFSPWHLTGVEVFSAGITLISAAILFFNLRDSELGTPTLVVGGVAYVAFIVGLRRLGAI